MAICADVVVEPSSKRRQGRLGVLPLHLVGVDLALGLVVALSALHLGRLPRLVVLCDCCLVLRAGRRRVTRCAAVGGGLRLRGGVGAVRLRGLLRIHGFGVGRLVTAVLVRHLRAVDLAFGLGRGSTPMCPLGASERFASAPTRESPPPASGWHRRVVGSCVASTSPAVTVCPGCTLTRGHLARALEVEVGLAVRSEVSRERHRLGHRSERRDAGPIRHGRGITARQEEGPRARGDEHDDDADDEWLAEQATPHVEQLPKAAATPTTRR